MIRRLRSGRSQLFSTPGNFVDLLTALILFTALFPLGWAQELNSSQLEAVKTNLATGAKASWELGTRAQALIEYDTPTYSVLNSTSLPPPKDSPPSSLNDVFSIAQSVVRDRANSTIQGPQPLIGASGEAAGDPPSIGVAVLLANWTGRGASDNLDYGGAAKDQLDYILEKVPRTSDGAISHRSENVQLWSDFVYMVPPFLAYYGVLSENQSLLQTAHDQCALYRQYLIDEDAGGMWRHIAGNSTDPGHWTTGNAWAAAGMLRVLGTIQHSQYSKKMKKQAKNLTGWISEIHTGMYPHLQTTGLFKNYADDSTTFDDASGTALLTSTVYRLALLAGVHTHLPLAEKSRIALSSPSSSNSSSSSSSSFSSSSPSSSTDSRASTASSSTATSPSVTPTPTGTGTSSLEHFTSDMWLQPVVNPYNVGKEGSHSPEGQAFVVEMYAAWRDWAALGSPGKNAAVCLHCGSGSGSGAALVIALGVAVMLLCV